MKRYLVWAVAFFLFGATSVVASDFAPAVPNLDLPEEELDEPQEAAPVVAAPKPVVVSKVVSAKKPTNGRAAKTAKNAKPVETIEQTEIIDVNSNDINKDLVSVEKVTVDPNLLKPIPQEPVQVNDQPTTPEKPVLEEMAAPQKELNAPTSFEPAREKDAAPGPKKPLKVVYNPPTNRDPTLSPDDSLLLRHREEERLRAIEAERQRKIEAERQRLAELERQRQLELERLRDPSREIRGKIHINGIIGQEVFIGSKVYTVGKSVLGARIVSVQPDSVVFMYKGQKFTKKVQLQ